MSKALHFALPVELVPTFLLLLGMLWTRLARP